MAEMLVTEGTEEEFSEAWYSITLAGEERKS